MKDLSDIVTRGQGRSGLMFFGDYKKAGSAITKWSNFCNHGALCLIVKF